MSFCSFSGEYAKNCVLTLDSAFITEYLPEASGDAVRVYLYGLYACGLNADLSIEDFCKALNLEENEVIDYFRFWEEYDLIAIIGDNPFSDRNERIHGIL